MAKIIRKPTTRPKPMGSGMPGSKPYSKGDKLKKKRGKYSK